MRVVDRELWRIGFAALPIGPASPTLPASLAYARSSAQYVPKKTAGGIAYHGTTASNDQFAIGQVGPTTGWVNDFAWSNQISPSSRDAFTTNPWFTGANAASRSTANASIDGTSAKPWRFSPASGSYANFVQRNVSTLAGAYVAAGAHVRPTSGANLTWGVWMGDPGYHAIGGSDLVVGEFVRRELLTTLGTGTTLWQFMPAEARDMTPYGGIAAGARDYDVDMPYVTDPLPSGTHGPLSWHSSTLAGGRLRASDPSQTIVGGVLDVEIVVGFPYARSQHRGGRLLTLDTGTWVEFAKGKYRIRASVAGVEFCLPAAINWNPSTDTLKFRVRTGNGYAVGSYAVSTDGGATFGATQDLGSVPLRHPAILAITGATLDIGSDGTTNQLVGVIRDIAAHTRGGGPSLPRIYASPTGSGVGSLADPASLPAALAAARASGVMTEIVLRGGTYWIDSLFGGAITIQPGDKITFRAYPGETPDFSGAAPLTGWTLDSGSIYRADVPAGVDPHVPHISVGGVRANMASTSWTSSGISGWTIGSSSVTAPNATIAGYADPASVLLAGWNGWVSHLVPVATASSTTITVPAHAWSAAKFGTVWSVPWNKVSAVRNAKELISADGDFAYSVAANRIYYQPRTGENLATADVRIPKLVKVVDYQSTANNPAEVYWYGITFSDSAAPDPLTTGWSPQFLDAEGAGTQTVSETWKKMDSAICVRYTRRGGFGGCTFKNIGAGALWLDKGVQGDASTDYAVAGCTAQSVAGTALSIGWQDPSYQRPSDTRDRNSRISVRSCTFSSLGLLYYNGGAIAYYAVEYLTVADCTFDGCPGDMIAGGCYGPWADAGGFAVPGVVGNRGWPYDQPAPVGPTYLGHLVFERLLLKNFAQKLVDVTGLHTWAAHPSSVIRDCYFGAATLGNSSGYIDNGTTGITCTNCVFSWGAHVQDQANPGAAAGNVFDTCALGQSPFNTTVSTNNILMNLTYTGQGQAHLVTGYADVVSGAGR